MSSQQYLNVLSENATRLGMRLSEHTRELGATMTRAGGIGLGGSAAAAAGTGVGGRGAAAYLDAGGSTDKDRERIRKQLESSSDREKLDAMRRLVGVSLNVFSQKKSYNDPISIVYLSSRC